MKIGLDLGLVILGLLDLSVVFAHGHGLGHEHGRRNGHDGVRLRRQAAEFSGSSILFAPSPSAQSPSTSSSSTADSGADSSNIVLPTPPATPTSPPSPVPTPMDLSISYSLSNDCLLYISTFLTTSLFQSCLPLSLLLTTSTSFRDLVKSGQEDDYVTVNGLLAYTNSPKPSIKECGDYFKGLEIGFAEKKHCAADLKERNPSAIEIRNGLGNYEVMRQAGGLVDPDKGHYCYLEAVAAGRPDDMYLWSLPAGISVPRTSTPTCSKCSGLLLNHYSTSLSSHTSLNSTIIRNAADTINAACGNTFVSFNSAANAATCQATLLDDRFTVMALLAVVAFIPFLSFGL